MSININSITEAHNAYIKGDISVEECAAIRERWAANIAKWDAEIATAKDENKYEITDDEANEAKAKGNQKAKEETGHDGKADTAKSVGTTVATGLASLGSLCGVAFGLMGKCSTVAGAAIIAGTGAAMYGVSRAIRMADPNGEEAETLQEMTESILPEANSELEEAQTRMEDAAVEIQETSDEANNVKEDANTEIENSKVAFDMYRGSAEILQEKSRRGEKLTASEKAQLQDANTVLPSLKDTIDAIQEETEVVVQDAGSTIEGLQGEFDDAADTIETVKGTTEFSANFDESTVDNTETVMLGADMGDAGSKAVTYAGGLAIAAGTAMMLMPGFGTARGAAIVALGTAGLATGKSATDQFDKLKGEQNQYKEIALQEIDARHNVEGFTENVSGVYDEGIDFYDESLDLVNNDMILEMPEDLEVPQEGYEIPNENPQATKAESQVLPQPEVDNKKEEKDKKVNKKDN